MPTTHATTPKTELMNGRRDRPAHGRDRRDRGLSRAIAQFELRAVYRWINGFLEPQPDRVLFRTATRRALSS